MKDIKDAFGVRVRWLMAGAVYVIAGAALSELLGALGWTGGTFVRSLAACSVVWWPVALWARRKDREDTQARRDVREELESWADSLAQQSREQSLGQSMARVTQAALTEAARLGLPSPVHVHRPIHCEATDCYHFLVPGMGTWHLTTSNREEPTHDF